MQGFYDYHRTLFGIPPPASSIVPEESKAVDEMIPSNVKSKSKAKEIYAALREISHIIDYDPKTFFIKKFKLHAKYIARSFDSRSERPPSSSILTIARLLGMHSSLPVSSISNDLIKTTFEKARHSTAFSLSSSSLPQHGWISY